MAGAAPRVLVTGGGTGGHVYPGLAVAEALAELAPGCEVRFAGTRRGIEAVLVPRAGYRLHTVPASGLRGLGHRARLLFVLNFGAGFARSLALLLAWRPAVVLGTGGFVSAPVMAAARVLGVPCALQEQNAIPGSTNRLVGRWSRRIYLGFAAAAGYFRTGACRTTGNPVRAAFAAAAGAAAGDHGHGRAAGDPIAGDLIADDLADFGRPGGRVLVFGGSGGAHTLNEAIRTAVADLAPRDGDVLLVQTGKRDHAAVTAAVRQGGASGRIRVTPYIDDMAAALAWADLVVARAGAMTLAELQVTGRPSVLVPFPHATDDHQMHNARALETAGAAVVLADADCEGRTLAARITGLLAAPEKLQAMATAAAGLARPAAARHIAGDLLDLIGHPAGARLPQDDQSGETDGQPQGRDG